MRSRPLSSLACLTVGLALLHACASGPSTGSGSSYEAIERHELEGVSATNAYEIVQQLRPRWLSGRGQVSIQDPEAGTPVVYVDGMAYGSPAELQGIARNSLEQVEFLPASEATTRFGTGHAGGVIMVHTRH